MPLKVIGIIPARYASTRFPGKPLVPILGKTLLQRTFENAKLANNLDQLIIATDDVRIYDHAKDIGADVVMTSIDCLTGSDRLAEVINQSQKFSKASVIINIQGDEPCIAPQAINDVANILLENNDAVMSTVATKMHSEEEALNPSIVKCVLDQKGNALYFSRSLIPGNKTLSFAPPYYRHIGLYAYRPDFLLTYQKLPTTPLQLAEDLEQLKVLEHGYRIKVAVTDHISPGVDTPQDIHKIECWLCKQNTSL
ncbi:MAG: 3-deoxy-manno-octulosonate cytidylyltransferase [Parachlamydiaceae bacterium]|nr:3-deoxy-manno-octulosonate cytidylyltransferase [Parachlamydiaceae bacterium]